MTAELDALVFTPAAGMPNASSTTTFTLSDQSSALGAPVINSTTTVIDSDPPAPPSVTAGNSASYKEGAAPALVDGALTVSDPNGLNIVSASVTIGDALAGDELTIDGETSGSIVNGGNTIDYSFSGDALTLSGSDTAADYQAALRLVAFDTPSLDPTSGGTDPGRTISWSVSDSALASTAASTDLTIDAIDIAPTVSASASYSGAANAPAVSQAPFTSNARVTTE